ncbi:hypothetical protein Csa_023579, partial [Cucumis sativus]
STSSWTTTIPRNSKRSPTRPLSPLRSIPNHRSRAWNLCFVNITDLQGGKVGFGFVVLGSKLESSYTKSVV